MPGDSQGPSTRELSRRLALALEQVAARVQEMSFEDIMAAYDKIEVYFLQESASDEVLTQETKRRVAELKFYACIDKGLPFDICRDLLNTVTALGFTNLEKKSNIYLAFAHYCGDVGQFEEATYRLSELRTELDNALHAGESRVYRQILQQTERLLKERP